MWTYSTLKQFITHFFRIFNQTKLIWCECLALVSQSENLNKQKNTDVYLWVYSFQSPSIMFWVSSNQKDFVTNQNHMVWHCFGIFQRATVLTPLWRRGPSSARLYSTSNTTPWQVSEVCHHFYIYNKSTCWHSSRCLLVWRIFHKNAIEMLFCHIYMLLCYR